MDGQGCDFWNACLAVALRAMRPLLSRAQDVHFDVDCGADRALAFAVRVDRNVVLRLDVDLLLEVRPRASANGATRAMRSRARTMRYGWHDLPMRDLFLACGPRWRALLDEAILLPVGEGDCECGHAANDCGNWLGREGPKLPNCETMARLRFPRP